jgi:hypothetical protein
VDSNVASFGLAQKMPYALLCGVWMTAKFNMLELKMKMIFNPLILGQLARPVLHHI